jgi:NADH-quinone oxidoreductase subunit A
MKERGALVMDKLDTMVVYTPAVLAVVAGMLILSHFLGERHHGRDTDRAYESGMIPFGSTRAHLWVPFYLLAILFVIFDLEVVFLFSWAVAFRELGWTGFWGALVFIGVLAVALVYEWRQGTFDWGPRTSDITPSFPEGARLRASARPVSGAGS